MKYLTVYAGIGIAIRDIEADTPDQAAQLAMDAFDMDARGGDVVYVTPRAKVESFFVQQDKPTLEPRRQ